MKKALRSKTSYLIVLVLALAAFVAEAYALAGIYIYANDGSYYTQYGPSQYWYTTSNEGFCGHISSGCSPAYMKYTYSSCGGSVNYALWNNIDSPQNGVHKVFVPRVNATTTRAPYTITYNGASGHSWTVNQYAYYDQWIQTGTYYDIRNTWGYDDTCEGSPPTKIGFDEVQIGY